MITPLLLRKIIIQWIFPPGGIIIAVLLIYLFLFLNKKKMAAILTVFLVLFLLILGSWLGEKILLSPLEDDYPFPQEILSDRSGLSNPAMVVLGGAVVENVLSGGEQRYQVGEVTLSRLYGAYLIYQKVRCPVWVSGGTAPGYGVEVPVTNMMSQVLMDLGIPSEEIYKEGYSRTTFENAVFTLDQVKEKGYNEIILVTSAVHMRRAVWSFENDDIAIIPASVDYLFENTTPGILEILPNQVSWNHNLRALHEWVGLLYYRLFY